jgi:hypothetical protein
MNKQGKNFEERSDVQEHCSIRHSQVQEFLGNGLTIITLPNLDKLELVRDKLAKSHCQLKLNNASRHFNNIFFKIQVLHSLSEFSEMAIPTYSS